MTSRTKLGRLTGVAAAAVIGALGLGAMISAPTSAEATVFVGFGFGFPIAFPGYYYPSYPYYPPPPPPYYPLPAYYPTPPASYQPSAGYPPSGGHAPLGLAATPPITYTPRPGWTNAEGQIEPGRWQSRDREVRHRLSRRERPVVYRQLTAG
jgi:hypothetical protein